MINVYLGLGANIGNPVVSLCQAIHLLKQVRELHVLRVASVWKTAPVGYSRQPDFFNTLILCSYGGDVVSLYREISAIEQKMGKNKLFANGPRSIDIDVIYIEGDIVHASELVEVPHPRFFERLFVLLPLREIYHGDELAIPVRDGSSAVQSTRKVRLSARIDELMAGSNQKAELYIPKESLWWLSRTD